MCPVSRETAGHGHRNREQKVRSIHDPGRLAPDSHLDSAPISILPFIGHMTLGKPLISLFLPQMEIKVAPAS